MNSDRALRCMAACAVGLLLAGCPKAINRRPARIAVTSLVSLGQGGVHGNGVSTSPAVTPDGRFLAFVSSSTNLTPEGTGGHTQVFRRDLTTGTTILVSADSSGLPGNGDSDSPSISADGLRIAFRSQATSFSADALAAVVPGSTDVYVRNLSLVPPGTVLLSGAAAGGPSDSSNGAFSPAISQDGQFVAFVSFATNLVSPLLTANLPHAYRIPSGGGPAVIADVQTDGSPSLSVGAMLGVSLSGDGRFVAFDSDAGDLGGPSAPVGSSVYVRDMSKSTSAVLLASPSLDPSVLSFGMSSVSPTISADGTRIAFVSSVPNLVPGDANGVVLDAFVRDLSDPLHPRTILVSVRSDGTSGDLPTQSALISPDGKSVAFVSQATNLVDGDLNGWADAFWHDLASGKTIRVSVDTAQREADQPTELGIALTGDGSSIFFASAASNLVTGDTNGLDDVFVRGPLY